MRLDQTQIAIRERSFLETLDLALHVVRAHASALGLWLVAGILPFATLNSWLLADLADNDFYLELPSQYLLVMVLLVLVEAPLATALATLHLGHATFTEQPETRRILRELWQSLPQLALFQGMLRILFIVPRPFLNEVILLERNPVRAADGSGRSTLARSRTLHRGDLDPVGRWFGTLSIGGVMMASFWVSMCLVRGVLTNRWWDLPCYTVLFPLALWMVVGFFAVVRFLCYLDLRIRREGWEIELAMRAEAARLTRAWK